MWEVLITPTGRGLIVKVTDGTISSVVGRVSWHRWQASHAMRMAVPFKTALRQVIKRAEQECETRNYESKEQAVA